MLEVTGEYLVRNESLPYITKRQKFLSYLWPQKVYGKSEGADWVRYMYFEDTWIMRRGQVGNVTRKLVGWEDLRERNKRNGLNE